MQDEKTISGSIVHITDGAEADARDIVVEIEPVQSGSGTPSPSNVRPITGWDDVSVYVTGKNLIDAVNLSPTSSARWINTDGVAVKNNVQYTLSAKASKSLLNRVYVIYADKASITQSETTSGKTFLTAQFVNSDTLTFTFTASNDTYIYLFVGDVVGDFTLSDVQIELGTTATTYEPYNGTTTTTTLPSTTYGGTIDLVSGVLTVDRAMVTFDGSQASLSVTTNFGDGYNRALYNTLSNVAKKDIETAILSDKFEYSNSAMLGLYKGNINGNGILCLGIPDTITTQAEMDTWATANPFQIVYELATPTTAQLTGQQIELLRDCFVWADAGDITLTYETELLDGRFHKIKVNDNSIIAPNNFELEREDVYTAEYTTCTGKLIADKIGWKYADTTMQWDTLPDDMLAILTGTTGAFTLKFTDSDGSHTENVIRLGVRNTATRFTDDFGNALWRNIELEVSFTNVH